ncbi:MAG TPA: hypothetical protein VHS30_02900, partial [Streptosporangiaceae bacterium]|nr:hypothetical protein [Streptosporangiaceae bacterium]
MRAAAVRAAAVAAACFASPARCGVIQLSIGPSAARQTLAWWPPPGTTMSGTFTIRVCSRCLKSNAAPTSALSSAPTASQKAG